MLSIRLRRSILVFTLAIGLASVAWGQESGDPPTLEEVEAKLAELGDDPGTPDPANETIAAYRSAKRALEAIRESRERTAELRARAESAPRRIEEISAELSRTPPPVRVEPPPGAGLQELERLRDQAEADLRAAREELEAVSREGPARQERLRVIPGLVAEQQTRIAQLRQELAAPVPPEMAPERAQARRWRLLAELALATARVEELQTESASYDSRRDLIRLRATLAERRGLRGEEELAAWQRVVNERRALEAREATRRASEHDLSVARDVPALRELARDIEGLIDDLQGTDSATQRLEEAGNALNTVRSDLARRQRDDAEIRRRAAVASAGAYGQLLQTMLRELRDERVTRQRLDRVRERELRTELRLRELEDLDRRASDTGRALGALLDRLGPDAEDHEALARRLVEQRATLVDQSLSTHEQLAQTLRDLEQEYITFLELTRSLRAFVADRVFWVRSVPVRDLVPGPTDYGRDARWLVRADHWGAAMSAAGRHIWPRADGRSAVTVFVGVSSLLLAICLAARWRLVVRGRAPLPPVGPFRSMTMPGTLLKLGLALASALPVPLALWVIASWLQSGGATIAIGPMEPAPAPVAASLGLSRAAFVLLGLSLFRAMVRRGGVGVSQFRWSEPAMAYLRRHLRWLTPLAVVGAGVIETFDQQADSIHTEAIGRTTLVLVLAAVAVFHALVFRPSRPFVAEIVKRNRGGLIERLRWFWYPALVLLPASLCVGAAAGYVYTALQIQRSVGNTYLLVLAVIVGQALVLRALYLARRRIAIDAARARAEAASDTVASAETAPDRAPDAPPKEPESAEKDLATLSLQSRKVVQALSVVVLIIGLYAVWSDVMPALRWFERVQIFPTVRYIDPDTSDPVVPALPDASATEGAPPPGTSPSMPGGMVSAPAEGVAGTVLPARVTVADIGLALLLLVLTVSASRNVPGLLEFTLLSRLPLDAATRYAVYSVARYLIIIVGVVAVSKALSIPWRSAQWLAAALTFGLAFGMQEIFANFVSGLIMLFEQPVRVGDTVTVGGTSGTVSKIRMRATTVVDWDNKELIIPNKNFITDQVVNWTLSNRANRITVPVGIAYGSDTELARDILLKLATESTYALADPPPRALFLGFGDNSLQFEVRVYVDDIANLLTTRSDLHFRIDKAFREAGIEIAFPQRDLHLRSVSPKLLDRIRSPGGGTTEVGGS
jgi:potassium-dependent mechanosensitive channel